MALETGLTGQPMPIRPAVEIQALAASDLAQPGVKEALRYSAVDRKATAESRTSPFDLERGELATLLPREEPLALSDLPKTSPEAALDDLAWNSVSSSRSRQSL